MPILGSLLVDGRTFVLGWLATLCDSLWLPLLRSYVAAKVTLLGEKAAPGEGSGASSHEPLLIKAMKRFSDGKYGKQWSYTHAVEPFSHQVAGHTAEVVVRYMDLVLKPKLKQGCFYNEIRFYETVFSPSVYGAYSPQRFVPAYHGVVLLPSASGEDQPYIAMEDQTARFQNPSIIDIKMGRQTYEPGASLSKIERTKLKYPYQTEIGFRLTGLKVYDAKTGTYYATDKSYGRSLCPNDVAVGLLPFFYDGYVFRRDVINIVIEKLELLLRWFKSQNQFLFFCSSLLIVYESGEGAARCSGAHTQRESMHFMSEAKLRAESMGNFAYYNTSPARRSKWLTDSGASSLNAAEGFAAGPRNRSGCKSCDDVQIRMIDFAHTLPSPDGLTDTGYIHGLTSLIRALRGTLELMTVASVDEIIADVGSIMRRASENPSYITNK